MTRVGSRFRRAEPRRRARALVAGLPRKNCWTIAEHAGDATPDGMQHLLARAKWDADGVRDDVRGYVAEHLGDPRAVLVAGETGDLKKGSATAGVQRQYTGTAGRVENAQVAVYLGDAARRGHALIDRELYLPKSWTSDPARCAAAGIPADVTFATKPQLARRMIERAVAAKVPFAWVAGDEVYGDNGPLRTWLEQQHIAYVLAVACRNRRTGELAFYRCYSPDPVPLIALVVHLSCAALLAAGIWLFATTPNVVTAIEAIFVLLLALALRHRLGSFRGRRNMRFRADAPLLFDSLDRVAAEVGAKPAHGAVADGRWNTSYASVGWRRRLVVTIGLPLWDVLSPDQRVAVLGHESPTA